MSEQNPAFGDYIIFRHAYGFDKSGPVSRVTDLSAFVPKTYGNKERRVDIESILFVGDEQSCISLTEKLRSSASLQSEEVQTAALRRKARDLKFISDARAALSSHTEQEADRG